MLHKELKQNDQVVFTRPCDIIEKDDYEVGSVIYIDEQRKTVAICYLEGYKSRTDDVPFNKVHARYNPEGEYMRFGTIHGKSELLTTEV